MKYELQYFWWESMPCENYNLLQEELRLGLQDDILHCQNEDIRFTGLPVPHFVARTPLLQKWLKELRCPPKLHSACLISVPPYDTLRIHSDSEPHDLAINLGIEVVGSTTDLYSVVSGDVVRTPFVDKTTGLINAYYSYSDCELKCHTTFSLEDSPVLFNTRQVHGVTNNTSQWRVAVSVRFTEEIDFLIQNK